MNDMLIVNRWLPYFNLIFRSELYGLLLEPLPCSHKYGHMYVCTYEVLICFPHVIIIMALVEVNFIFDQLE